MRLFRELPSFRRTVPNMSVGKLVIEFAFTRTYKANGNGWRTLSSIWLPFYRET